MKTIYLSRRLDPVAVDAVNPGDIYSDPVLGDCRRLTARRLCLAADRAGKESVAILGLLAAIGGAVVDGMYDGRAVADWYGLVGVAMPERRPAALVRVVCPQCKAAHYALDEDGEIWGGGFCSECIVPLPRKI